MDQTAFAVLLSYGLYVLYVLLPLIPAVIIYRMFPDTRVTAEGSVSNWKVKAGGAFGAYITVVLLGYVVVARTEEIIGGMSACTWTISGKVELRDNKDQLVNGNRLLKTLQVTLVPDIVTKNNQFVELRIPGSGPTLSNATIGLSIPMFGEETIDLEHPQYHVSKDSYGKKIEFTDPIVIRQFVETEEGASHASATPTPVEVKYQEPLKAPGPPPAGSPAGP